MNETDTRTMVARQTARMAQYTGGDHPVRARFLGVLATDPRLVVQTWQERDFALAALRCAVREWWPRAEDTLLPEQEQDATVLADLPTEGDPLPCLLEQLLPPAGSETGRALSALGLL